jgi:hypothetical protein
MEADRTNWGAQQYADALNRAATPADVLELVDEVNTKWATAGDPECAEQAINRSRIAS